MNARLEPFLRKPLPKSLRAALTRVDRPTWILLALGTLFGLVFSRLSWLQFASFFSFEYQDAAIESQLLYSVATQGFFQQTIFHGGRPDHFWPIAYILAPLYWIHPGVVTWKVWVCFSHGLCAPILFRIARNEGLPPNTALAVSCAYLIYVPLHFVILASFDGGRSFVLPFFFLAILFQQERSLRGFLVSLLLASLCKEDMPLIGLGFAAYQAWKGFPRRWWLSTLALSAAYLAIAVFVTQAFYPPWPSGRKPLAGFHYLDWVSVRDFAAMFGLHFSSALEYMLHPTKLRALFLMGAPLLFLPLRAAELYIPSSMFAILLLARPRFYNQNSDYLAPLIPFFFFALCVVLARLAKTKGTAAAFKISIVVAVLCFGQMFTRSILGCTAREGKVFEHMEENHDRRFIDVTSIYDPKLYTVDEEDRTILELIRKIPDSASVTASGSLLPLLSSRKILYEFGSRRGASLKDRRLEEERNYSVDIVLIDRECRVNGLGGRHICPDNEDFEREIGKILNAYRYHQDFDDGTFAMFSSPRGLKYRGPYRPQL